MSSNEIETNDMDGSQLEEQGPSSGRCSWQGNIGPHHANPVISKRRKWTSQGNKIVGHSMWNYQDRLTYLLRNGWNLVCRFSLRSWTAIPIFTFFGQVLPEISDNEYWWILKSTVLSQMEFQSSFILFSTILPPREYSTSQTKISYIV